MGDKCHLPTTSLPGTSHRLVSIEELHIGGMAECSAMNQHSHIGLSSLPSQERFPLSKPVLVPFLGPALGPRDFVFNSWAPKRYLKMEAKQCPKLDPNQDPKTQSQGANFVGSRGQRGITLSCKEVMAAGKYSEHKMYCKLPVKTNTGKPKILPVNGGKFYSKNIVGEGVDIIGVRPLQLDLWP